jgi:Domain of unknown function (DUF4396)
MRLYRDDAPPAHASCNRFPALSALSTLAIVLDIALGRRQKMAVMNFVWPITALWAAPLGLIAYWCMGRSSAGHSMDHKRQKPFWQSVLIGDSHCGAGCTLGDFAGEWFVFLTGLTIAGSMLWADYVVGLYSGIRFGNCFSVLLDRANARTFRVGRN